MTAQTETGLAGHGNQLGIAISRIRNQHLLLHRILDRDPLLRLYPFRHGRALSSGPFDKQAVLLCLASHRKSKADGSLLWLLQIAPCRRHNRSLPMSLAYQRLCRPLPTIVSSPTNGSTPSFGRFARLQGTKGQVTGNVSAAGPSGRQPGCRRHHARPA